ncbi:MAG: TetR/AcrR family transcriptional regulator [Anaerolineae bacterium]|nr:TetR/AcrR family transcriptional regulator [Anaerolineae bacterium]
MADYLNRHAQRKAATHQSLIDAARAVIVEQGYSKVEILDITERADVSKATFYTHFPNKEACVREMMEQGFDALVEELLKIQQTITAENEWIETTLGRVFSWAQDNRELLLIMVGGAASSQLNVFGRTYMADVVERTLVTRQPPLAIRSDYPPTVQAQVVTGIMIQLLGWWLENDVDYSAQDLARLVREVLQRGLSADDTDDAAVS